jgi:STE24 endopeptidase
MNIYLFLILLFLVGAYILDMATSYMNLKAMQAELPEEFKDSYDAEKYRTSQEYTKAGTRFSFLTESLGTLGLIAFILIGGFPYIDDMARSFGFGETVTGLVFFGLLFLLSDILSLPAELYRTFVLEERFGFNNTTPKLFVADKLKGYALMIVLGAPIGAAVLWFFASLGDFAWLTAWVVVTLFLIAMQYLAPTLILPLFNTFTPLEDGELRRSLESYANSQGFELSGLFVMDGSKRSKKSNAFFTGFGKRKRVALFDTLIENHSVEEITAVLAHEIGHYKKKHIITGLVTGILRMGLIFYLISFFLGNEALFAAFGMETLSVHAGLVFFFLLYTPLGMLLGLGAQILSRKHEYEADNFAVTTMKKREPMIAALKKLSVDNLSNLTPHPAYVFINYSHPPVAERIRAIREAPLEGAS